MEGKRRVDRITSSSYLEDVETRSLGDIRSMRQECSEEESLLSYERRLLHGRLAILRAELDRRAGGGEGSLIEKLPEILAGEGGGGASRGSFPSHDPHFEFDHPQRRVSKLVSDDTIANLANLDEAEIRRIVAELEDAEREVSTTRRAVLDALDALTHELGRRYKVGEADPSDVLTGEA